MQKRKQTARGCLKFYNATHEWRTERIMHGEARVSPFPPLVIFLSLTKCKLTLSRRRTQVLFTREDFRAFIEEMIETSISTQTIRCVTIIAVWESQEFDKLKFQVTKTRTVDKFYLIESHFTLQLYTSNDIVRTFIFCLAVRNLLNEFSSSILSN